VILDFINKLKATPEKLEVLGNGQQSKPYLHVSTLVEAMVYLSNLSNTASYDVFNIGEKDSNVSVTEIAEMVRKLVNPNASIIYGTESYGWLGDMPKVEFNLDKLKTVKWSSKMNGKNAVLRTINEILENHND